MGNGLQTFYWDGVTRASTIVGHCEPDLLYKLGVQ